MDQRTFQLRQSYSASGTPHTHIEMGNLKLPCPRFGVLFKGSQLPCPNSVVSTWCPLSLRDLYPGGAASIFLQTQILAVL